LRRSGLLAVVAAPAVLAAAGAVAGPSGPHPPARPPLHAEAPPAGYTGGFGESDCTACHLDAGPDLPGGSLEVRGLPSAYRPGGAYELEVILRAQGTERSGFQLALRHSDGRGAGRLTPLDDRVQILAPDSLPTRYAAQTRSGSEPRSPDEARWVVRWVAPEGGRVHLHAAANSADGDESPLGDLVFTTRAESRPAGGGGAPQP